jgi:predicted O-methyltransferase YrrM
MRQQWKLKSVPRLDFDTSNLRVISKQELSAIFRASETEKLWTEAEAKLREVCCIEDLKTDGVNPGDRRAVWYLVNGLKATSVLECGTHVGASTIHIASAMQVNANTQKTTGPRLVTLDIYDVNDGPESYWRKYGLVSSPRKMMEDLNCNQFVTFVTKPSLEFLKDCTDRFDFIFLDGDHNSSTVYQEIQQALKLLKKDGVILLHDYFPNHRPLWPNGSLVPGPFAAGKRLLAEGVAVEITPLGELPWATKINSKMTSLALVTRK